MSPPLPVLILALSHLAVQAVQVLLLFVAWAGSALLLGYALKGLDDTFRQRRGR